MSRLIIFSFFFFLFTSCETDVPTVPADIPANLIEKDSITPALLDILIFKKEKKVELWENNLKKKAIFINKVEGGDIYRLLTGHFAANGGKMQIEQPGEYYGTKIIQHSSPLYYDAFDFSKRTLAIKDLISTKDQEDITKLLRNYQLNQVIIFPNDLRANGKFDHCINCPHWIVEVYGKLELLLNDYPSSNS